jgi:hypothetical protein
VFAVDRRLVGGRLRSTKTTDCASILRRLKVPRDLQWDTLLNSRGERAKHCYDLGHPCTGTLHAEACEGRALAVVAGIRENGRWSGRVLGCRGDASRVGYRVVVRTARPLHPKLLSDRSPGGGGRRVRDVQDVSFALGPLCGHAMW